MDGLIELMIAIIIIRLLWAFCVGLFGLNKEKDNG